jgi:hypothetical protein
MRALGLLEHWPEWERTGARIALLEQAGLARLAMGDMAAQPATSKLSANMLASKGDEV